MIIIGTNDLRLQEELQLETDFTLEFAIKAGQTTEATRRQKELQREPTDVNFTKSEKSVTSQRKKAWGNSPSQRAELLSPTEKNNRMQILFILILSRQLHRIQPNLQHQQKRNHFAKIYPSNKYIKKNMQNDSDSLRKEKLMLAASKLKRSQQHTNEKHTRRTQRQKIGLSH